MPKLKNPVVRSITTNYISVVNNISKVKYLDHFENKNKIPPFYHIDGDGVCVPCDIDGNTAEKIWHDIEENCEVVTERHKDEGNFDKYEVMLDFQRLQHTRANKQYRIRKKVDYLLWRDCIWLTLTFRPNVLEKTKKTTRRRYVKQYLDSLGCKYICNIDYGNINKREHYHAIVQVNEVNYKPYYEKCGAIKGERITFKCGDDLTKYIWKLTNHCVKQSTNCERIMTNVKDEDLTTLFPLA